MHALQINDENASPFYDQNVAKLGGKDGRGGLTEEELEEANLKHAINGRQYCNLAGLNGKTGDKIRWHSAALVSMICSLAALVSWRKLCLSSESWLLVPCSVPCIACSYMDFCSISVKSMSVDFGRQEPH